MSENLKAEPTVGEDTGDNPTGPATDPLYAALIHVPEALVPRGRLRLRLLPEMPTPPAHAQIALLEVPDLGVDHSLVGVVWFDTVEEFLAWQLIGDRFGAEDFTAYAHACRLRGQPPTVIQVVDMLISDALTARALDKVAAYGATLARVLGADGRPLDAYSVWPVPRTAKAEAVAVQQLDARHPQPSGARWDLWADSRWVPVRSAGGLDQQTDATARTAEHPTAPALVHPELPDMPRGRLIGVAADHGVLLAPDMDDEAIRAALRAHPWGTAAPQPGAPT